MYGKHMKAKLGKLALTPCCAMQLRVALFVRKVLRAKKKTKRNFFDEFTEGFEALADARQGKRTLRTNGRKRLDAFCKGLELRSEGGASQSLRIGKWHYLKQEN